MFGLLTAIAANLARRTKQVDDRRDEAAALAVELARERERSAIAERDAALERLKERNGNG